MPAGEITHPSRTEEVFLLTALRTAALRTDGRKLHQARSVSAEFSERLGWCQVHVGDTIAIASVNATLCEPRNDRPYEGILQVHANLTPMAGVEYDTGGVHGATESREREALFERLLERAVRHSEAVDREALCVLSGKVAWCVDVSVHILADQGAAMDAAVLASMLALRQYRRPEVTVENGQVTVHSPDERVPVPLALHHVPLCVSYAIFVLVPKNDQERSLLLAQSPTLPLDQADSDMEVDGTYTNPNVTVALLDPSLLECTLAHSNITFVMNAQREVCVLDKAGGVAIPYPTILGLLDGAAARARQLSDFLESQLAEDSAQRVLSIR